MLPQADRVSRCPLIVRKFTRRARKIVLTIGKPLYKLVSIPTVGFIELDAQLLQRWLGARGKIQSRQTCWPKRFPRRLRASHGDCTSVHLDSQICRAGPIHPAVFRAHVAKLGTF